MKMTIDYCIYYRVQLIQSQQLELTIIPLTQKENPQKCENSPRKIDSHEQDDSPLPIQESPKASISITTATIIYNTLTTSQYQPVIFVNPQLSIKELLSNCPVASYFLSSSLSPQSEWLKESTPSLPVLMSKLLLYQSGLLHSKSPSKFLLTLNYDKEYAQLNWLKQKPHSLNKKETNLSFWPTLKFAH